MAQKIGIRQWTFQRLISGARVPFDPRTTAEVVNTRDPNNYRAIEKPMREYDWRQRQADKRNQSAT